MNKLDWLIRSYFLLIRLDKPIGIILLLLPCWWGVVYIQKSQFSWILMVLFLTGSVIMRSAGCIVNDLLDKKFDQQISRTKDRPLAAGIISKWQALSLFCILCFFGLCILLQLHPSCWGIGIIGLFLLIIYPLMKRITNLPQLCLGFAFNIGFLMGIVATTGKLSSLFSLPVLLIYIAAILWTIAYDTIYAVQDRDEDILVGIRSTAILFGEHTRIITMIIYQISAILMIWAAWLSAMNFISILLIIGVYGAIINKLWSLDLENTVACRQFFIDNQWIGVGIFIAFML